MVWPGTTGGLFRGFSLLLHRYMVEDDFLRLKELLTATLNLTLPVEGEDFIVNFDTSSVGLGWVLT